MSRNFYFLHQASCIREIFSSDHSLVECLQKVHQRLKKDLNKNPELKIQLNSMNILRYDYLLIHFREMFTNFNNQRMFANIPNRLLITNFVCLSHSFIFLSSFPQTQNSMNTLSITIFLLWLFIHSIINLSGSCKQYVE